MKKSTFNLPKLCRDWRRRALFTLREYQNKIWSQLGGRVMKKSTFYHLKLSKQDNKTNLSQQRGRLMKKSTFYLLKLSKQDNKTNLSQQGGRVMKKSTFYLLKLSKQGNKTNLSQLRARLMKKSTFYLPKLSKHSWATRWLMSEKTVSEQGDWIKKLQNEVAHWWRRAVFKFRRVSHQIKTWYLIANWGWHRSVTTRRLTGKEEHFSKI